MTLQQAAKDAITVQDACNLSGVVHSFSRILAGPLAGLDTDARNRHPIARLFASKIGHLTGIGEGDVLAFSAAFDACEQLAVGPVITLRRGSNSWLADFAHAAGAAEMQALMGTTLIPMPFGLTANPVDVIAAAGRQNPDHRIILEGASQ